MHRLDLVNQVRATSLKELAVRVIVDERNLVGFHDLIVEQLRRRVDGEASSVGHTKSLRHFVNITLEIYWPVLDGA